MADDSKHHHHHHHHGVSKFLSRDRWRSKSNPDDPPKGLVTDQNVADFLKPGAASVFASASGRGRPIAPAAPRIDIAAAQKWAGNSADLRSGNGMPTPSSLRPRGGSQRKPRRPGLTVTFSVIPDIIGEGGEECEAPTMEISLGRAEELRQHDVRGQFHRDPRAADMSTAGLQRSNTTFDSASSQFGAKPGQGQVAAAYRQLVGDETDQVSFDDDSMPPKPIKRSATGFSSTSGRDSMSSVYSDENSDHAPDRRPPAPPSNAFQLPEFSSLMDDSPLDLNFSRSLSRSQSDSSQFQSMSPVERSNKIQKMRLEEGLVMHQNSRRSIIDLAAENVPASETAPKQAPSVPNSAVSQPAGYRAYSPVDVAKPRRAPTLPTEPRAYTSAQASYQPQLGKSQSIRENKPPESLPKQSLPYRKPVPPGGPPAQLSAGGIATRPTPSPLTIPPGPDFHANAKQPDNHSLVSSQSARSQFSDMKSPPTATSAKAPSATSQAAYDDFGRRCEHMKGIFRLQAEFEKSMSSYTPTQWLRAAAWWFVRGRAGMESIIRSRPRSADGQTPGSSHTQLLTQPHVDLAKSWWILAEVIPAHHSLPPSSESLYGERAAAAAAANDGTLTEFFDSCDILNSSLKALLSSMNRNHVMPPHSALIQGQDQTIWVQYPPFAPDILPILSGGKRSLTESAAVRTFDPLSLMAIGDTKKDFSYYRWFVNATISADDQAEQISFQCLFSVMRARNDWHPKVGICSQKELVSLCITGERKYGPSWEDVKWSELDSSLQVKLPHGYTLNAQLAEPDYHLLVSMYKKAFTVQTSLFPRDDERLLFEAPLETFQYADNMRPPAFPLERMRRCRVRLFGISEQRAEGRGTRRFYRGLRILVVTSPKNRQLADVSHEIGLRHPILIEMLTENAGNESFPAMSMFITEDKRQCSLFMVFSQLRDRQMLYSALNESDLDNNEMQYASSRLKKLSIEPVLESEAHSKAAQNPLGRVQWQEVVVLNKDPMNPDDDFGETVLSDRLRIVAQGAGGTVTDRINLGKSGRERSATLTD
jgi:hypothetical protein